MSSQANGLDNIPLWDMDGTKVDQWIRSIHALFPKTQATKNNAQELVTANALLKNLLTALKTLHTPANKKAKSGPPSAKRAKTEHTEEEPEVKPVVNDTYNVWFLDLEDLPPTMGGILAQLSHHALTNAMSGVEGGLLNNKGKILEHLQDTIKDDSVIQSAANISFEKLKEYAQALKRAIVIHVEKDVLVTTPIRIQQMLCPELADHEFRSIRKRVFDTVILGKGVSNNVNEELENVVVASRGGQQNDSDKYQKCKVCGNNDQSLFVLDRKNGDVICTKCGTVAMASLMHEGSMYRKFEGEADRNHHGDAPNSLYSNAHNMSTTLGGVSITTSAGGGGFGSQKNGRGLETILRNAHAYTEMNISQFGEKDRRTRVGYKDRQKRDAFIQMAHVGDALNLHEAVVQRAKELFAGFRNDRELVQQFKGVVAACLCEAFDQLSKDGMQILKGQDKREDDKEYLTNSRANRRNNLHSAKMAGKGGLLLDFSEVDGEEKKDAAVSAFELKPVPSWNLDDVRSCLLDASSSIAKQWGEQQEKDKRIPRGSVDDLEGKLVEQTLALCDLLEQEVKKKNEKAAGNGNHKNRVVTPRLDNLGTLSIRWQHSHERGSGGKGGVGNSGRTTNGTKPGEHKGASRTAGQVLILKSAKKLGDMLGDPIAGEAFHKELRALVGRQEARKRKEMRNEAARQRHLQMKRKPWLQARAQSDK